MATSLSLKCDAVVRVTSTDCSFQLFVIFLSWPSSNPKPNPTATQCLWKQKPRDTPSFDTLSNIIHINILFWIPCWDIHVIHIHYFQSPNNTGSFLKFLVLPSQFKERRNGYACPINRLVRMNHFFGYSLTWCIGYLSHLTMATNYQNTLTRIRWM